MAELLKAAGAKVLSRAPAGPAPRACSGPCSSFLLCEAAADGGSPKGEALPAPGGGAGGGTAGRASEAQAAVPPAVAGAKWYQKAREAGAPVVSHRWLLDSISSYTLQPLASYRL